MAACGTRSGYVTGCRCDECRGAQRVYMQKYYAERGGNKNRKPEYAVTSRARLKARGLTLRKLYPETFKALDQRRRAQKKGATAEKFTAREVFERDAWTCGICEQSVDPALKYPDPASPSLDHITPLSLGGDHTRANTRCSHLGCNVKRGNRAA